MNTNKNKFARKVLDATTAEQVYNPEKYQIINSKI